MEDRAYLLMGLLDVNMPMLYGEGKKAFHRLQLEIIRASNDQSIFAWDCYGRTGSTLAADPSDFHGCGEMELMRSHRIHRISQRGRPRRRAGVKDRLGSFPITDRGIQMWLFIHPSSSRLSHLLPSPAAMPLLSRGSTSDHRFDFAGIQLL